MTRFLIALDVDGVLNTNRDKANCRSDVGPYFVSWNSEVVDRLLELDQRDDVTIAWLTDWLIRPEHLDALESALGVPAWMRPIEALAMGNVETNTFSFNWYKIAAFRELIRDSSAEKAVWFDDNLESGHKPHNGRWQYGVWPWAEGLTVKQLDEVEAWFDAEG